MSEFVETFRTCLMHVCLFVLAISLTAIAVRAFWKASREGIGRFAAALRGMPLVVRMMAVVVLGNLIVYGSTKAPGGGSGGDGEGGDDGSDDDGEAMCLSPDDNDPVEPVDTGFTAEDVERGFALVGIGSDETWDLGMPEGATAVESWLRRGASEDVVRIAPGLSVFSDGQIAAGDRILAPLNTTLGIVPAANWPLLPEGIGGSLVWYGATGPASFGIGWRNVLLGRDAATIGSFGAEFFRDGRIVFKYAGIPDGVLTNAFIGALSSAGCLEVAGNPGVTSVRLHTVESADLTVLDRDGDGLSTYDEIHLYGTDPDCADTDGDGVPDGEEVALGGDPLVRNASDSEILARVARQAADTAFGAEIWEVEGELAASALWSGFAADVVIGADSATNVVYERTIPVDPRSGWTRHFLSARPDEAHGWWLDGLRLEWSDDVGDSGSITASPLKDSVQLELSPDATTLTVRLVATDAHIRSSQPIYLLAYTPRFEVSGGQAVPLSDGTTAYVFTNGQEAVGSIAIDRSRRPCRAALLESELGVEACRIPEEAGVWPVNPWERTSEGSCPGRAAVRWGDRIVVAEPSMTYGVAHEIIGNPGFPYDTPWLLDGWWQTSEGLWRCGCRPEISWGGFADPLMSSDVIEDDGHRATGVLRYADILFWTGSAEHLVAPADPDPDWACSCPVECPHCTCKRPDGVSHGSVRFRISLGETALEQVAGFAWFSSEGPVLVTPALFACTARGEVTVADVTGDGIRDISVNGQGGRTVSIAAITNGVTVAVTERRGEAPVRVWEIVNVDGDPTVLRFVERTASNEVLTDETWTCVAGAEPGAWDWESIDNLAPASEQVGWEEMDGSTNLVFNAAGNLVSMSEVLDGGVTNLLRTLTYDDAGRLTLVDDGTNGCVSLEYDAEGRLVSTTGPEGTLRLVLDDEGNPISLDTSSWTGDLPETVRAGVMMLSAADPVPQKITPRSALAHFLGNSGDPLAMCFSEVDTSGVSVRDFSGFLDSVSRCRKPGPYPIDATHAIHTKGDQQFFLGHITLRLAGIVTVGAGCSWSFSGELSCCDDRYDFNAAKMGQARETLTSIGRILFGWWGTPYSIKFVGTKPMSAEGGCGGSAAR